MTPRAEVAKLHDERIYQRNFVNSLHQADENSDDQKSSLLSPILFQKYPACDCCVPLFDNSLSPSMIFYNFGDTVSQKHINLAQYPNKKIQTEKNQEIASCIMSGLLWIEGYC